MGPDYITIVSGLPRSGTSMMMRVLVSGGLEALVDDRRQADDDNPLGYFELEKVKQLDKDNGWLAEARGKVVKIISALLRHLPPDHHYRVIFMRRRMEEILASQRQMLIRRGESTDRVPDDRMASLFERHLADVEAWLSKQPSIRTLFVSYNDMISQPLEWIGEINRFLDGRLQTQDIEKAIDTRLYRQRR